MRTTDCEVYGHGWAGRGRLTAVSARAALSGLGEAARRPASSTAPESQGRPPTLTRSSPPPIHNRQQFFEPSLNRRRALPKIRGNRNRAEGTGRFSSVRTVAPVSGRFRPKIARGHLYLREKPLSNKCTR
ncbi:hypothetical protein NL676_033304 [Syzygium grande]|nr:hypothetical protein NL676_033304 [Syzygium grande]